MGSRRLDPDVLDRLIDLALAEDIGPGDVTTRALVDPARRGRARIVARERGVLAGIPVARRLLRRVDPGLRLYQALADGSPVQPGSVVAAVRGPLAPLLTVERLLLNVLQRLSGIATQTRRYVDAVAGTGARVLDTRKTLPGWRALAKYAVSVGGGQNHRAGLYDQILIKDNHLAAAAATPAEAVAQARAAAPRGMRIEVEVETVRDARAAAAAGADIVMLDNMPPRRVKQAVAAIRQTGRRVIIEASGRVTLRTIRAVAATGVDWISVGALTHSAKALDLSLEVEVD